jgi:hypothetical protein
MKVRPSLINGWYTAHGNQACPVLFGVPPA